MAHGAVPMSASKRFVVTRVFPWAVVLFGAVATYLGIDEVLQARASASWPAVEGTITRSSIEQIRGASGGRDRPASVTQAARVEYAYTVDGVRHVGSRIAFGHYDTADADDARRVVARYPVGTPVRVHHRPGQPGDAVLEPGSGGVPWLYLGLGLLFTLVGAGLAVVVPRLAARPQDAAATRSPRAG